MAKMFHLVVFQQHFVNNFKISSECNWYRWIKKNRVPSLGTKHSPTGNETFPREGKNPSACDELRDLFIYT